MATRIPINKDGGGGLGFDDRQKRIWEDMESDMERRRREWEEEIEKMRKEFFMLRPEGGGLGDAVGGGPSLPLGFGERMGPRSRLLETTSSADDSRGMVVKDDKGNPVFKVLFDVHDYRPEEVSVKMDTHKIMVTARHEAKQGGSSVSREYSRQVRIPSDIDPMTLQCTMGPDGILAVEAPIPAPSYAAVQDSATTLPIKTASPGSSSSSPASSSAATSAGTAAAATAGPGAAAGTASAAAAGAPLQQQSSSTTSSSYQTYQQAQQLPQRGGSGNIGPEPVLPAGFKPVSAPFQNSTPPPPSQGSAASLGTSSSSSQHHQHPQQQPQQQQQQQPSQKVSASTVSSSQSSFLDNSGLLSGFPKVSPPFQPLSAGQPPAPGFSPPMPSGVVGGGRIGSPVVSSETGKFKLEIDIEDFRPEELTVKTQDKRVVVCARREEKSGNRSSTRELSREHTIPDSVDPLTIKAFFTDGGKLIIEAPYREAGMQSQVTGR